MSIKNFPEDDRPREKLQVKGVKALSDAELIAIILRSGTKQLTAIDVARNLLESVDSNLGLLSKQDYGFFKKQKGIGNDKASTLAAAFELNNRAKMSTQFILDKKVTDPSVVTDYFVPYLASERTEKFIVLCLNASNKIVQYKTISEGSIDASIASPREIFKFALDYLAKYIILIHNHPSGNLEPSNADIKLTHRIREAGLLFDIKLLDHIIVAGEKFVSMRELRIISD
ncbi:MAG: DNA repair protein RadC [Ignavibacteriaceae bacterium]|nr:DNA repair protein RadC [Ignavibacteriaceae bacterium]